MYRVTLREGADLDGFRAALRRLIAVRARPTDVAWIAGGQDALFGAAPPAEAPPVALPRAVSDLIGDVICHRDPERFTLLHSLVWRIVNGERSLLAAAADPLVHRLTMLRKSVSRDIHKMHAFVRFRRIDSSDGTERFAAWFEPEHFILEAVADFFVRRFEALHWSIITPVGSLHWDRDTLTVGPAGRRGDVPESDAFEAGWLCYYESTFNPARANPRMMRQEMPKKYWQNMPEARAIAGLLRAAPQRVAAMVEKEASVPTKRDPQKAVAAMGDQDPTTLEALNKIIAASAPLVPGATQAVLGEGPADAELVFVGEQPGDQEDVQGRPFVGPAGQLLTRALEEAGIDRGEVYLTNAVKHFKFEPRGKQRIHQKPTMGEVKHYRWWLMKELALVKPRLVVALGGTAAAALSGHAVSVTRARGPAKFENWPGFITVHPSYLLRIPEAAAKKAAYAEFLDDLRNIRRIVAN
ncbi:UdgX family uracil-DNA binding protein [Dongia rigui]|uniref:Type-4 uracil-DNA glycosylase n=1 Tax=Dongia rigui TaxID=940149 RepID=A0ABU5DXD9_9PROT|nr:UdgX family uracil-DNA binding protein [Dongia rigui]MDY0871609.1 UdgX family uracil-DNA binding protein [Dongia rigui]